MLRYFVVGVYLIVVGIIANRFGLNDLTYYNSMITMCFLGEMVAFGFNEGFGIYINQNISDLNVSKKYAKLGFRFTIGFVLVIALIFAIFPNFILTNIFNLNFDLNLSFYYLMIVVMVLMTAFNYINLLLKKTGIFKFQLIISAVQCFLIPCGMALILCLESLMLVPVAIIYIITHIICVVCGHFMLVKNKDYGVNIFSFEKLTLNKQEVGVIFARALSEVVWEIGYVFVSLFILKLDVVAYNQYCYFENALDIFNGPFFAFVSVVSIKICRCIGEEKKEEAKFHAKYSILAVCVIWLCYAVISLLLYIPLREGMNVELQDSSLIVMILYLVISLLRFNEWNIGTYILGQSEYFAKGGLILEIVFAIYWIVLFLIASVMPHNVWFIYLCIAFENIVKILVSLIFMKNGKWLNKSMEPVTNISESCNE